MPFFPLWNDLHPNVLSDPNKDRKANWMQVTFFAQLIRAALLAWGALVELLSKKISKRRLPSLSTWLQQPCQGFPWRGPGPDNSQHEWGSPSCILASLFLVPWNKPGPYSFTFSRDHGQGLHLETKGHKKNLLETAHVKGCDPPQDINLLVNSFEGPDFLLYQEFIRQHITGRWLDALSLHDGSCRRVK